MVTHHSIVVPIMRPFVWWPAKFHLGKLKPRPTLLAQHLGEDFFHDLTFDERWNLIAAVV